MQVRIGPRNEKRRTDSLLAAFGDDDKRETAALVRELRISSLDIERWDSKCRASWLEKVPLHLHSDIVMYETLSDRYLLSSIERERAHLSNCDSDFCAMLRADNWDMLCSSSKFLAAVKKMKYLHTLKFVRLFSKPTCTYNSWNKRRWRVESGRNTSILLAVDLLRLLSAMGGLQTLVLTVDERLLWMAPFSSSFTELLVLNLRVIETAVASTFDHEMSSIAIKRLLQSCPSLSTLSLSHSSYNSASDLRAHALSSCIPTSQKFKALHSLFLHNYHLNSLSTAYIDSHFPALTSLSLTHTSVAERRQKTAVWKTLEEANIFLECVETDVDCDEDFFIYLKKCISTIRELSFRPVEKEYLRKTFYSDILPRVRASLRVLSIRTNCLPKVPSIWTVKMGDVPSLCSPALRSLHLTLESAAHFVLTQELVVRANNQLIVANTVDIDL